MSSDSGVGLQAHIIEAVAAYLPDAEIKQGSRKMSLITAEAPDRVFLLAPLHVD